ncbi:hypothetical protein LguiA_014872 [Lonicera macranthoides]
MDTKKSRGRRKIEMKMISNKNARRITFSKRRNGLFKKASELTILCGTEILIIVFSMGGKVFSFGHPSVEHVLSRFLDESAKQNYQNTLDQDGPSCEARIHELGKKADKQNPRLAAKKIRGKKLQLSTENSNCKDFEESVEELDLHELKRLKAKLENLKENLGARVNEMHLGDFVKNYGDVDLSKFKKNEADVSSIPYDWLRL